METRRQFMTGCMATLATAGLSGESEACWRRRARHYSCQPSIPAIPAGHTAIIVESESIVGLSLEEVEKRLDEIPSWVKKEQARFADSQSLRIAGPANPGDRYEYGDLDRFNRYTLFQLHSPSGQVDVGWGSEHAVNAYGERIDTGEVNGPTDNHWPRAGVNQHCMLAYEVWGTSSWWYIDRRVHWGCSVMKDTDAFYTLQLGGMPLYTYFNDIDRNNSGEFQCTLEWFPQGSFYEKLRSRILKERARSAAMQ